MTRILDQWLNAQELPLFETVMTTHINRRSLLKQSLVPLISGVAASGFGLTNSLFAAKRDPKHVEAAERGLEYLRREQRRQGYWEANGGQYRVAMTALSGTAMLCEGSTTTRGRYAEPISRAVDYLLNQSRASGLIGFTEDYHYTYGHGFSMLFLSQVFGEEDDADRRAQIKDTLQRAVTFSIQAQTSRGGWGYISAKDGSDFDEGSTCITQVQGLRACRNAGIVVPKAAHPDLLKEVGGALRALEMANGHEVGSITVIPLIESAIGVRNTYDMASSLSRIECVMYGGGEQGDLVADLVSVDVDLDAKGTGRRVAAREIDDDPFDALAGHLLGGVHGVQNRGLG